MAVVEAPKGTVRVRAGRDPATGEQLWITLNAQARTGNSVFVAWSEAEMLTPLAAFGDLCVREDQDTLYYYSNLTPPAAPPTAASDWRQVVWTDAEHAADEAAMLALSNLNKGDLVYRDDISVLYIKEYEPSSDMSNWMQIASRHNTHRDVANVSEMLALPAEKGDLAIRIDESRTYSLWANPPSILANWAALPGGGTPTAGPGIVISPDAISGDPIISTNLGPGIVYDPFGSTSAPADITINLGNSGQATTLPQALEITPFTSIADPDSDILQVKEGGIKNIHIGAQIGSLIDVSMTASDTTTLVEGQTLVWDPGAVNPSDPTGFGAWVPGVGTLPTAGPGITIAPDPITGEAFIQVNTGAGIVFDPLGAIVAPADIRINLDNAGLIPTLPQALEITPFTANTDPDSDILQVKEGGIKNIHIGAQIGSLIDVSMTASDTAALLDGQALIWSSTAANPSDPTGLGAWVPGAGAAPLAGPGIATGLDPTTGATIIQTDLGPGMTYDPFGATAAPAGLTINLNNNGLVPTLPQALEITPYTSPTDPDSDILQIKELGIKDRHIGASLGSMVDVNYSSVSGVISPTSRQDGYVLAWDSTFADPVSGAVGQWVAKAPSGTSGALWNYVANATGGVDPGLGNLTAVSDLATPATWTFEVSATDADDVVRNLLVMQPGDTLTVTDNPLVPPVTTSSRFSLLTEPVDNVGWYTFTAAPIDTPVGTPPVVGDVVRLYSTFGQGGLVKALGDLTDVETTGVPGYPAGPVGAEVLRFDPNGGGAGIPLWVPGPDTHVVFTPTPILAPEPTLPDGSPVPEGTIWISPGEIAPLATAQQFLPLTGGDLSGDLSVTGNLVMNGYAVFTGGNRVNLNTTVDAAPIQWCTFEARKSNGGWLNRLWTNWTGTHSNGPETEFKIEVEAGGYGTRTFTFQTSGNLELPGSPVVADVAIRASESVRRNITGLDRVAAGRVIDALQPVVFERVEQIATAEDATDRPPRVYDIGLAVEDIEGIELADRLVKGEGDSRGYSLSGLLAVTISEVKRLSAELAELKAQMGKGA